MSLYKRKDSTVWWIKIYHKKRCLQRSTGTSDRRKAQEYHDKLKASLWEQDRLGVKPSRTWQEAVIRFVAESSHRTSTTSEQVHFRWLDQFLGDKQLHEVDREMVETIKAAKLAEGASHATVNRILQVLRAVLRRAMLDWEWSDRVPRIKLLPERKRRVRWLKRAEAERLIAELPSHLAAMVRFSLETGLRQANVTGLEWSQVDLPRRTAWIHADQAKARKAIAVPLSETAMAVLSQQLGRHATRVFTYQGKPVAWVNTKAWKAALRRAGIEDFRWHDLRHTWASWHVQAGTPLYALQELGGWETMEMVRRYAHFSTTHLAPYAEAMSSAAKKGYVLATVHPIKKGASSANSLI